MNMTEDPGNATIVQSTIDLGHNLGLKVVAEGVESEESYKQLAALGCDYAQGYFFSRPLSPEKATVWLETFTRGDEAAAEAEHEHADEALGEWVLETPAGDAV